MIVLSVRGGFVDDFVVFLDVGYIGCICIICFNN